MEHQPADHVGRTLARLVAQHPGADVVDIGGGSGTRAVPLAQAGCRVLVVDASTDALASLARRAAEAGVAERVSSVQADADQLASVLPVASADLVLYHHVVQDVDDPAASLAAAAAVLRPGGYLSVLVPGRLSAVLAAGLAGRSADALSILAEHPAIDRRYDAASLRALLERAGVAVESVTGAGVLTGLMGNRAALADEAGLAEMEREFGRHPVLSQIAADLHGVGLRPAL